VKPVFDFKFDVTKWIGKPIAVLPYASKLKTIFSEHSSDERLSYKVEIKGNTFVSSLIPLWDKIDFNDYLTRIFNFYTDVQLVDSHYKLNLVFPDLHKIPKKALIEIDELRSLLMYKEYWAKDRTLTFKVNFKNDRTLLNDFLNNSDMRIETGFTFNILGKKVKIDKMYVEINNPKLNLSTFELEELLKSKNEFILLEFITDKNSKIVFRIIEEEIKSMENKYV
jgi:hypothetical protein